MQSRKIAGSIPAIPSMIHFTSDQHYFHRKICEYSKRPFANVEEMNEALIRNHNAKVAPEDTVWSLGDFAFCELPQLKVLLSRLNGTKHHVLGNHDRVIEDNRQELLEGGHLASIQNYAELRIPKHPLICLFHYGARVWRNSHHSSIFLYGHSHGSLPPWGKSMDVGVDSKEISPEYRPYSLSEVMSYMAKRDVKKVDHHG